MFQSILSHYFDTLPTASILPLNFKVLAPYDYHLYLCDFRGKQYVVVEADYLSGLPDIVKDAEKAFSVTGTGWCVLTEHRKEAGRKMLPPDADDYDPDGTNDQNHKSYVFTTFQAYGMQ